MIHPFRVEATVHGEGVPRVHGSAAPSLSVSARLGAFVTFVLLGLQPLLAWLSDRHDRATEPVPSFPNHDVGPHLGDPTVWQMSFGLLLLVGVATFVSIRQQTRTVPLPPRRWTVLAWSVMGTVVLDALLTGAVFVLLKSAR